MKHNCQKLKIKYRAYQSCLIKVVGYCMLITVFSAYLRVKNIFLPATFLGIPFKKKGVVAYENESCDSVVIFEMFLVVFLY